MKYSGGRGRGETGLKWEKKLDENIFGKCALIRDK